MDHSSSITPDNHSGKSSDTFHEVTCTDERSAVHLFNKAKERLLDINHWKDIAGEGSSDFKLYDEQGNLANRPVKLGDHFRIDIPGPGTVSGKGYDWVQVEAIEQFSNDEKEEVAVRVRPADDPTSEKKDVAHFFSEDASSTFSVIRIGKKVIASVQGRNEKPNTGTSNIADKVRNTVIAAGALMGLNKPQWKSLVKGLLS